MCEKKFLPEAKGNRMNVHVLIAEHDNGSEVIGVYNDKAKAERDAQAYQDGAEEVGNIVEFYVETHYVC